MKKIENFYDLNAWQKAHRLTPDICKITEKFPKTEQFGITNQIRRASSSVSANIAEGFARYHYKDKARFYYQARGSVAEVYNFLLLIKDLGLIDNETHKKETEQVQGIEKLINGLIRSIKNQK